MEYREAYSYFYGKKNHFWDMGLDNIKAFLARLGSPENKLNIVQVAGTNGKGSVSVMLAGILISSGYRVGRYNSPAVFEDRENITVDNIPMSEEEFAVQVSSMYNAMEEAETAGRLPTVFELETAMAIQYFYQKKCDIVILEAGLGGEKDATNVSESNRLAVITSVSLDHMAYLGDTVEKIAEVKAGIIKDGSAVAAGINKEAVTDIIRKRAEEKGCSLVSVNDADIKCITGSLTGQTFSYKGMTVSTGLLGRYQTENAALAIEAALELKEGRGRSYDAITEESIRKGIRCAAWRGRFQPVSYKPLIITDGAHNPDAAQRLRENIETYLDGYNIVAVMGVFRDKDYRGIIDIMKPYLKNAVTVTADSTRALPAEELMEEIRKNVDDTNAKAAGSYREALQLALAMADGCTDSTGKPAAVIAFGSLSYLKYITEECGKL